MKIARFSADGWESYGLVEGDRVRVIQGDIILTGAPGAVEEIHPGDVVEVEIPGIGTLRNPIIADK